MTNRKAIRFEFFGIPVMKDLPRNDLRERLLVAAMTLSLAVLLSGCGPNYRSYRMDGQKTMLRGAYGPARIFFLEAERLRPRNLQNLNDLGVCSLMLAREKFKQVNHAAAMRELDDAIAYFTRAIDVYPGHQASLEGKNRALELQGQFEEALKQAEWAARFVGPSAKQQIFLARELEERGDVDGALLRYSQAVAMEPDSAEAHTTFAKLLLRHHNEPAAVQHLQAAYRINPLDRWVVDQLASRSALPSLKPETPEQTPPK